MRKVLHVDVRVALGGLAGPLEQRLLEGDGVIVEDDVRQLEVQDYRPDQTERQLRVAVHNVVRADVHQFDLEQFVFECYLPKFYPQICFLNLRFAR